MATTALWAPNQALIAQVKTYTFSAPNSVGNTYKATINGKTVTYSSVSGDTAATAASGLYALISQQTSVPIELTEILFANPSSGVLTATARVPGTPFADVPGTGAGLVLSTGNGLVNGITSATTQANQSPNDVNDSQNWLRITPPAAGVRQLPQNGDNMIVADNAVSMLWNLDQLAAVQLNTYTRYQTFTGTIGLPYVNPLGYVEWRAKYFKFVGPAGSVPAGGLQMVLGFGSGTGPQRECYDVGSQLTTLTVLATGTPQSGYAVNFLGVHTQNVFTLLGGASMSVAMYPGEIATLLTGEVGNKGRLAIGPGVTWTSGSVLTMNAGGAILNSAPASLVMTNGAQVALTADSLTWASITMQGGSQLSALAGGTITNLTMTTRASLDKSRDARTLTITNSTIDGDTCSINDPLTAIVFTNATSVKQRVTSGPFLFTGTRTVKVT